MTRVAGSSHGDQAVAAKESLMFTNILVPTDGTELSLKAVMVFR